ncbi:hypothetical protein, partial [Xanthomonas vasicola]|uniref:hypothetical protein n=1 Tax=Xanthomonas vasicola TaxID=56459 RepID=UPI001C95A4B7
LRLRFERRIDIHLALLSLEELRHRHASLELHGIDAHRPTSLASGDNSISPGRRRSCDCRLRVRANQVLQ